MQIKGKEVLSENIPIRVRVTGFSMLPLVRGGDYLVIRPLGKNKLKVGDIVVYAYSRQDKVFCHRLVKIESSRLLIKGDTHIQGLEIVQMDNLLGKAVAIEHGSKRIDLETGVQPILAGKIAWLSLHLPALLYIIAYAIEILRNPAILWHQIKRV